MNNLIILEMRKPTKSLNLVGFVTICISTGGEKISGTSVKSKPRISKRGNRNLRKVMHFPALAAIRTDERFRDIFLRLVSKHGIKMKAIVAIQRKLLELTFILWKNNSYYKSEHQYQIIPFQEVTE